MLPISFLTQAHLLTYAELTQLEGWIAKFPDLITVKAGMMDPKIFLLTLKLIRDRGYQDYLGIRVENSIKGIKND